MTVLIGGPEMSQEGDRFRLLDIDANFDIIGYALYDIETVSKS